MVKKELQEVEKVLEKIRPALKDHQGGAPTAPSWTFPSRTLWT